LDFFGKIYVYYGGAKILGWTLDICFDFLACGGHMLRSCDLIGYGRREKGAAQSAPGCKHLK